MQNCLVINTNKNPLFYKYYLNNNIQYSDSDSDDSGDWGQFIDIECLYLFPKQIITKTETTIIETTNMDTTTVTTTKTTTTTNTKTVVLKSILKKPKEPVNIDKKINEKYENDEEYNYYKDDDEPDDYNKYDKKSKLQEFVERQLYVGCLICVLTVGFYFIPE